MRLNRHSHSEPFAHGSLSPGVGVGGRGRSFLLLLEHKPEPTDFFTLTRGSCQRLPNGNTLIANSESGEAFEVYGDGLVALRKDDNPEVLFMSRRMADFFESNMPGQGN